MRTPAKIMARAVDEPTGALSEPMEVVRILPTGRIILRREPGCMMVVDYAVLESVAPLEIETATMEHLFRPALLAEGEFMGQ